MRDTTLPCPFCGFDAMEETIVDVNEGVAYTPWYVAGCGKCMFVLPGSRDYDEAVAQWNRRSLQPAGIPLSEHREKRMIDVHGDGTLFVDPRYVTTVNSGCGDG